jgi:hypothetical protein
LGLPSWAAAISDPYATPARPAAAIHGLAAHFGASRESPHWRSRGGKQQESNRACFEKLCVLSRALDDGGCSYPAFFGGWSANFDRMHAIDRDVSRYERRLSQRTWVEATEAKVGGSVRAAGGRGIGSSRNVRAPGAANSLIAAISSRRPGEIGGLQDEVRRPSVVEYDMHRRSTSISPPSQSSAGCSIGDLIHGVPPIAADVNYRSGNDLRSS